MDLGIKDKASLVAGGTNGMGRAAALALAAEGSAIVVVGRNAERAAAAAVEIRAAGASQAHGIAFDVSAEGGAASAVAAAVQLLGRLDGANPPPAWSSSVVSNTPP